MKKALGFFLFILLPLIAVGQENFVVVKAFKEGRQRRAERKPNLFVIMNPLTSANWSQLMRLSHSTYLEPFGGVTNDYWYSDTMKVGFGLVNGNDSLSFCCIRASSFRRGSIVVTLGVDRYPYRDRIILDAISEGRLPSSENRDISYIYIDYLFGLIEEHFEFR